MKFSVLDSSNERSHHFASDRRPWGVVGVGGACATIRRFGEVAAREWLDAGGGGADGALRHPLSSYRRSCADERACQGWRSHHVVTPKAPFTRPIGKSDNCADEERGRCPPAAGRDSLTRRRLAGPKRSPAPGRPGRLVRRPIRANSDATFNREYGQPTTSCGGRSVSVAESQPRDLLRRYPATDCRAARPRARDERQGRTAARRGALARRLDPIERNSAVDSCASAQMRGTRRRGQVTAATMD